MLFFKIRLFHDRIGDRIGDRITSKELYLILSHFSDVQNYVQIAGNKVEKLDKFFKIPHACHSFLDFLTLIPKVNTVMIALNIMAKISCQTALCTPAPALAPGQFGSLTFNVELLLS